MARITAGQARRLTYSKYSKLLDVFDEKVNDATKEGKLGIRVVLAAKKDDQVDALAKDMDFRKCLETYYRDMGFSCDWGKEESLGISFILGWGLAAYSVIPWNINNR